MHILTINLFFFFFQLESLVQDMQDKVHGVPVRHQKVFLTSIPFAFMGKFFWPKTTKKWCICRLRGTTRVRHSDLLWRNSFKNCKFLAIEIKLYSQHLCASKVYPFSFRINFSVSDHCVIVLLCDYNNKLYFHYNTM